MEKKKTSIFSTLSKQLTATVSVALVLLILGLVGSLAVATRSVTDTIKENLGFNLIMADSLPDAEINAFKQRFNSAPYVASYDYFSADEILRQEEAEIGEDIVEVIGVNPYQPEFNVRVKADYASVDSIAAITAAFDNMSQVSKVAVHTEMVRDINTNIRALSLILIAVAAALLLISFVLINNTVRLTIYSRRFLLHTMRLVGATAGFIRRPIIVTNIVNGVVAGALAIVALCAIRYYAVSIGPDVEMALPWSDMTLIFAAMIVLGVIICGLASLFATNKYLRQNYDDLF